MSTSLSSSSLWFRHHHSTSLPTLASTSTATQGGSRVTNNVAALRTVGELEVHNSTLTLLMLPDPQPQLSKTTSSRHYITLVTMRLITPELLKYINGISLA